MKTELFLSLAAPFDPSEVKAKPQMVKGNRALALFYVDNRVIMDRLDDVVGLENWKDEYVLLADNTSVMCKLSVRADKASEWITKSDVAGPSEQPDGSDRMKAAFSDAMKRAAVKFGIGRYLYRLPQQWCDYDPTKRQFTNPPRLPDWAVPGGKANPATPAATSQLRGAEDKKVGKSARPLGPIVSGVERLNDKEYQYLCDLIDKAAIPAEMFYRQFDVPRVADLPADKGKEAADWLRKMISEKTPSAA